MAVTGRGGHLSKAPTDRNVVSDASVLICAGAGAFALARVFAESLCKAYAELGLGTVSQRAEGSVHLVGIIAGVFLGCRMVVLVRRRLASPE